MNLQMGLSFCIWSLSFLELAHAQSTFEERMHEIYKTSYSTEISDDQWADYVSGIQTRTYQVVEGDTLWDLSLVFFGDGQYWSKIWSYNQGLTNPHMISVGQEVAFFSGSMAHPPGFSVDSGQADYLPGFADFKPVEMEPAADEVILDSAQAKILSAATDDQFVDGSRLYPGAPSIPPPRDYLKPAPNTLPRSFKDFDGFNFQEYNFRGVSLDLRPPVQVNPLFIASSFLYSDDSRKYPRIGKILESENGNSLLSLNDRVYIQSQENLKVDEVFTIMTPDYTFDRNGIFGTVIRYAALVRIQKKLPDNLYTAEIVSSLSGVKRGSWITRETIPTFDDDHSGRPSDLKLTIIGGGIDNTSRIYGEGDIIYLQGGNKQGVRAGDVLGIYKVRKIRYVDSEVEVSPEPIAHLKVFRAEERLSSAFIINSIEEVLPGDRTGSPTLVGKTASTTQKVDLNQIETGLDFNTDTESLQDFEVR